MGKTSNVTEGSWTFQEKTMDAMMDASTYRKLLKGQISMADLLAREVIQNSEDASLMWQDEKVPFRMEFKFDRLFGAKAKDAAQVIDLDGLLTRANLVGFDKVGLNSDPVKEAIEKFEQLGAFDLLLMSDFGSRGLVGDLELLDKSAWFNALFSVGASKDKTSGAGGSFGFGKSAFVNGSVFSTVVAYTKTGPSTDKSSRRFGAVTYWNGHHHRGKPYTGIAAIGDPKRPYSWLHKPFEDDDADELARIFGFPERGDDRGSFGTTIAMVFPVVDEKQLAAAIEDNWWPALGGDKPLASIAVIGYGGERKTISPKSSTVPYMASMRRAYDLATTPSKPANEFEFKQEITSGGRLLGTFAAVADPETYFQPQLPGGKGKANFSRIALVRKPRMIVDYLELGKGAGNAPYVDGIFVSADDDVVEKQLRSFEPPLHNFWWPKKASEERDFKEIFGRDASTAFAVRDGIESALGRFKDSLRPPEPKGRTILKDFGHVLGKLLRQPGTTTGGGGKAEPIQIHFKEGPALKSETPQGNVFETMVEFTVEPSLKATSVEMAVFWQYIMVADEDSNGDPVPHQLDVVTCPGEFDEASLTGPMKPGETVVLKATSEPVPPGISLRAKPSATIIKLEAKQS